MAWFGRRRKDEAIDDEALRVFQPRTATMQELEQMLTFLRERLLEHAVDEGTGNVVDRKVDDRRDAEYARVDQQLHEYLFLMKRTLIEMRARLEAQRVISEGRKRELNEKRAALEAAIRALVGEEKRKKPDRSGGQR